MKGLNDAYVESIIRKSKDGKLTTGKVAAKLGINKRYANRLKKAYGEKGSPPSATETKARQGPGGPEPQSKKAGRPPFVAVPNHR